MHVGVSGKRLHETAALIVTRTGLCSWKQILGQIREAIIPRVVFKSPVCDFEEAELSVLSRALAGTASTPACWLVYIFHPWPLASARMKSLLACRLHCSSCCPCPLGHVCSDLWRCFRAVHSMLRLRPIVDM